ncbi:hypothetical protein Bhyg_08103 [Pseudolycoriella hygida]|uniref:Glycine-rich protein n=1 Tax=Pseudolycoriella hygida TaxID=35572 RepID=A0A9Q0N410_9DIPT|nr:hypothetical protein Bhyg_08103 [Pseudolycoriella hygida]
MKVFAVLIVAVIVIGAINAYPAAERSGFLIGAVEPDFFNGNDDLVGNLAGTVINIIRAILGSHFLHQQPYNEEEGCGYNRPRRAF